MTTPLRDLLDGVDVAMWELVLAADGHCPLSAHDQLVRDAVELAGLFRARVKRAFDGVVAS